MTSCIQSLHGFSALLLLLLLFIFLALLTQSIRKICVSKWINSILFLLLLFSWGWIKFVKQQISSSFQCIAHIQQLPSRVRSCLCVNVREENTFGWLSAWDLLMGIINNVIWSTLKRHSTATDHYAFKADEDAKYMWTQKAFANRVHAISSIRPVSFFAEFAMTWEPFSQRRHNVDSLTLQQNSSRAKRNHKATHGKLSLLYHTLKCVFVFLATCVWVVRAVFVYVCERLEFIYLYWINCINTLERIKCIITHSVCVVVCQYCGTWCHRCRPALQLVSQFDNVFICSFVSTCRYHFAGSRISNKITHTVSFHVGRPQLSGRKLKNEEN